MDNVSILWCSRCQDYGNYVDASLPMFCFCGTSLAVSKFGVKSVSRKEEQPTVEANISKQEWEMVTRHLESTESKGWGKSVVEVIDSVNSVKAKTDKVGSGLVLIPFYSILRLGKIFVEGLRYGRDNWKKGVGDKEYQEERLEHALLHFIKWKEGDRTEDHLAKVSWFCITQMELERLEEPTKKA